MSDNPKQRQEAVGTSRESEVDLKRLLNVGKDVQLSFGTFTVKELDVFSLMSLVSEGLETFVSFQEEGTTDFNLLQKISKDKKFHEQIAKILAMFCGSDDIDTFKKLKAVDFLKVIATIKEVVDFDEIKETFLALGLHKYLKATNSPTTTENVK